MGKLHLTWMILAVLALSGPGGQTAVADDTDSGTVSDESGLRTHSSFVEKRRLLRTSLEVLAANEAIWVYDRYIRENGTNPAFRKSFRSVHENLIAGWEWDDNSFATNHFLHPYQGALYFTAGRANDFSYYQSVPFAFAGSWYWEYLAETHHPSINDWINTSLGGIALGEAMHRLSTMILDNTAKGSGRAWREFGGLAVNPIRGINRLVTGEATAVHANPPQRFPSYLAARWTFGIRAIGNDRVWEKETTHGFGAVEAVYGDPFVELRGKPFDHFAFKFQVDADTSHLISRIDARGMLYGATASKSEGTHHVLAAFQHFDYFDNAAYTFGAQSIGGSFLSRFENKNGFTSITALHANVIVLGASRSDYPSVSGRTYDYGPGFQYKLMASFGRDRREYFAIAHEQSFLHSINGNKANHFVNFTKVRTTIPVHSFVGVGFEYMLYLAERQYADFDDVSTRNPEVRGYLTWNID